MQTKAPNFLVWVVAVIIGTIGILARFVAIPVASVYSFWFVAIGFVVLALSNVLKKM